jgi:multidrug efflux system outer membrane protein
MRLGDDIRTTAAIASALLVSGCVVGPDYVPPKSALSAFQAPEQVTDDPNGWWQRLGDPLLTELVDAAVAGNPDLVQAKARVLQARALHRAARFGGRPILDARAGAVRERTPVGPGLPTPVTISLYDVGFDAGWEIDLFGGVRRRVEEAAAEVEAAEEDRRGVVVALIAEVARNYVDLRGAQAQLRVAEASLAAQRKTAQLTQLRFEAGVAAEVDVARADALARQTAAEIPQLLTAQSAALHRIAVLVGQAPGDVYGRLRQPAAVPPAPPLVGIDPPAELLRRRPDIRAAERRVAARTAGIGVATAELYPRITLTGSIGALATSLMNLSADRNGAWAAGAELGTPILGGGRTAKVDLARAKAEEALALYRSSVLAAAEEVETGFVAYENERRQRDALSEAVAAQRRATNLVRMGYEAGEASFLDLLDAERSLQAAEGALAAAETSLSTRFVALFKALGGGWELFEADEASARAVS